MVSCVTVKCPPQVVLDVIVVPSVETASMDPQVKSTRGAFVDTHWKRARECVNGRLAPRSGNVFFSSSVFLFFCFTEWEMRGVGVNYGTMRFLFPFFLDRIKVKVRQVSGRVQLYGCLIIQMMQTSYLKVHYAKSLPILTNISGAGWHSELLFW